MSLRAATVQWQSLLRLFLAASAWPAPGGLPIRSRLDLLWIFERGRRASFACGAHPNGRTQGRRNMHKNGGTRRDAMGSNETVRHTGAA